MKIMIVLTVIKLKKEMMVYSRAMESALFKTKQAPLQHALTSKLLKLLKIRIP